ncbi:TetR/AcrR family transcriptional regulator [Thermaurantiacus sp.]
MAPAAALAGAAGRRAQAMADRRQRIVRAARDLIRETGETDLSMRALAQRAGVSLATPYNLFGSKRAVMLAVLEDERDFAERFRELDAPDSIARIFAAHDLAFSYYAADPDFYRTLWRALLDSSGVDSTGLASPERVRQVRAIWRALLEAAVRDGLLAPVVPVETLQAILSQVSGGALLFWTMGGLPTERLSASVGLGYALALGGVATPAGAPLVRDHLERYRAVLGPAGASEADLP